MVGPLGLLALGRSIAVDAVPSADQKLAGEVWDVVAGAMISPSDDTPTSGWSRGTEPG
jgi:hypothetical protein